MKWYHAVVLICMSLMASDAEHLCICLWAPLYVFLGEVSVQVFCTSFIGLLVFLEWSHVSSLYILEIKPLSEVSLANMFSHTVGSLFVLMLFLLAVQKEAFYSDEIPFVYPFLYVPCSRGHISENRAAWNI